MPKKTVKEIERLQKLGDIVGLIPRELINKLHGYGYYMLIPSDAFPFCIRAIHKQGFEVILEADNEKQLIEEANKALLVFNSTMEKINNIGLSA